MSVQPRELRVIHVFSLAMIVLVVAFSFYISHLYAMKREVSLANLGWFTIAQYGLITCFMFSAWWSTSKVKQLRDVRWLLVVAILVRIVLVPIEPYTSNDMDRYLFDGKIAISGLDPYRTNHNAIELKTLKTQWSPPEEHAKYPTLYPPLALGLFALTSISGPKYAPKVWKLVTCVAGILTVLVMAVLLKNMGRLRHLSLVALSPLLILETGVGAHVDAFSTLAVALILYFLQKDRWYWVGVFTSIGVLIKMLPLMLALPLFVGVKSNTARFQFSAALSLGLIAGYGGALLLGFVPLGSLGTLFEKWRFGSPLFSSLALILGESALVYIIPIGLIGGALVIAVHALRLKSCITIDSPLLPWSMAIVLLFSPVVFPWYLMVLVPCIALSPRPFFLAWVVAMPLTYEVLGRFASIGEWHPQAWPLIALSIVWIIALVFDRLSQQRLPAMNREKAVNL